MGNLERRMEHFRESIARKRNQKRWSQAEVAKKLTAMGVDNMHISTVAKIEAGTREVKLDEAEALADLYGTSVDVLMGRRPDKERDLQHVLDELVDAVFTSQPTLDRAARTLQHRLQDVPTDYERYEFLAGLVGDAVNHLDGAKRAMNDLIEESIRNAEQQTDREVAELRKGPPSTSKG